MKRNLFAVCSLLFFVVFVALFSMGCSGVQTVGQAAQIEAGEVVRLHITRNDTFSSDAFDTDDTQEISEYLQPVLRFQLEKGEEVDLETLEFTAGEYAGYLSFRSQKQDGTSVGFFFTLGGGGELPMVSQFVISQYDTDGQETKRTVYEIKESDWNAVGEVLSFWRGRLS